MKSYLDAFLKYRNQFAIPLCFLGVSFGAHATDITPESRAGIGSCSATGGTDRICWQDAINAAHDATTNKFGNVAGSSGKQYLIDDTIVVCNGADGVIDGHGAQLVWTGGTGKPMFLVVNSNHMRFSNLKILSDATTPLETAFEFASSTTNQFSSPVCQNYIGGATIGVSSKNSLDHVVADGVGLNGLNYGVRFSNRYSYDANNDQSTILDSIFYNVTKAAISIEHTQSHQHRLISVSGSGAPGNSGCFVDAQVGFFSSTGGFQNNWGWANFCVNNAYGTFDITESNSEGSNRMLTVGKDSSTGNIGDNTGYPVSVNIHGGRFAVNGLNSDGYLINFNRNGPLIVRGLHIDGTPPTGVQPAISMQPGQMSHTPAIAASAIIESIAFYVDGANAWDTIVAKSFIGLTTGASVCNDSTGHIVACQTPLRN